MYDWKLGGFWHQKGVLIPTFYPKRDYSPFSPSLLTWVLLLSLWRGPLRASPLLAGGLVATRRFLLSGPRNSEFVGDSAAFRRSDFVWSCKEVDS